MSKSSYAIHLHRPDRDPKKNRFWMAKQEELDVCVTTGVVGSLGKQTARTYKSVDKARLAITKAVNKKLVDGFFSDKLEYEILTAAEASKLVSGLSTREYDDWIVFSGDTVVEHNLEMDFNYGLFKAASPARPAGILVLGDLNVDGCLLNIDNDSGPTLRVEGSVVAISVATGGSSIHINGDLSVETEIVGVYNHGSISVDGKLRARAIVTEHTVTAGSLNALTFETWASDKVYPVVDGRTDTDSPYELCGVFSKTLVADERVNMAKAREWLAKGKSISQARYVSVQDSFKAMFGKKLKKPEKVKSLSLSNKGLSEIPAEVWSFTNLRNLDLSCNSLRTLPPEIGTLTELRRLDLQLNGMQCLPEEIGQLTKLEYLNLYLNCIHELPDGLANCKQLRHITLESNPSASLRPSFGEWKNVKLMVAFPEVLTQLPSLEVLNIDATFIENLPSIAFISPELKRTVIRTTMISKGNKQLHPQLEIEPSSSADQASRPVRYWFRYEYLTHYLAHDESYDWSEAKDLLNFILDVCLPHADSDLESCASALEVFKERVEKLHREFKYTSSPTREDLFAKMLEVVNERLLTNSQSNLLRELKPLFSLH